MVRPSGYTTPNMSADSDKNLPTWQEQLLNLEKRLQGQASDERLLGELGSAMKHLLSDNSDSEKHIRDMLQKQFDAGHLRKESYELVRDLLGRMVTEKLVESPLPADSSVAEDLFEQTAVIEDQAKAQIAAKTPPPAKKVAVREVSIGSVLRDRFLLKERVAEGSMGVVYKALDKRLAEAGAKDSHVAIKVLSPQLSRNGSALRALQQEAAKGRCLTHPNIVHFIDLDRDEELYFIVMEWLEGRSLSSILDAKRGSGLDLPTTLDIVRKIALALDYAHQRGVIHADVKPGNIILSTDGVVKLIDFGVAHVRQKEEEGKSRLNPAVMNAGTPAYSSMQVLTGELPAPADDVFSLACLMYRMVAGYRVFGPRNAAHAAQDGMEPQQPKGLSNEFWQILKKALAYSRVTRYPTPKAFVAALDVVSAKNPGVTKQPVPAPVEEIPDIRTESLLATQSDTAPVAAVSVDNDFGAPLHAGHESIMYEPDEDEPPRSSWRLAFLGLALIVATWGIATQTDLIDRYGQMAESIDVPSLVNNEDGDAQIVDVPAVDYSTQDIAEYSAVETEAEAVGKDEPVEINEELLISEELPTDAGTVEAAEETAEEVAVLLAPDREDIVEDLSLPPATLTANLAAGAADATAFDLVIREDSTAAIIEFVRLDTVEALSVSLVEARYNGNRSPLASGQYFIENDGKLTFAAGQQRGRLTVSMRSNPLRESDQQLVLRIVTADDPQIALATINLILEDDDQRAFEARLPANTVGFAVNQISVRESDPAAQIDVIRYKPDNTVLEVPYDITGVTATEGQDYFITGLPVVYFGPGQRSVRILIPLGQDARPEPDEAFMLQLLDQNSPADANIFSQIAVMIRDDDS